MKKLFIALVFASFTVAATAQEADPTEKYSVSTNSFWSNWFVQGGVQWAAFYASGEHGLGLSKSPFKSYRSNPQAAIAIGKWFTPGIGLRTKVSGVWGKAADYSFKYWNAQEQVLFNLSNLIYGYNPDRIWNLVPFAGAGFARNCSDNQYAMGFSVGLLNQFYVTKKVAINFELGWNRLENDFVSGGGVDNGSRGWDSHDNYLYAEVGVTVNLGKATWKKTPDVDAIKALSQSQIDALNAQLSDEKAENARLKSELANKKAPEVRVEKEFHATPVSVFFNLDKSTIASRKDLVNVKELANYAKDNGGKIVVTGYADSATGNAEYNRQLSQKRADRVANELVKLGVDKDNIIVNAKGGVDTLVPASYNRRVIVELAK